MSAAITPSSLFVVTGGGRGITARCVIGMARRYRCRFLLLGRTALDAKELPWAHGCQDRQELRQRAVAEIDQGDQRLTPAQIERTLDRVLAAREIQATLEAIRQAGGQADYRAVDVGDEEALRQTLVAALQDHDSVTGIIHGAGVLADKAIARQTLADFAAVFTPKVHGLANLLACLPLDHLQYLILFSSAAAYFGNLGQAAYALANEVLNKAAYRFKAQHPACQVLAIDWGPWDAGMVTPELEQLFAERGVGLISADQGVSTFLTLLGSDHDTPQVVVGQGWLAPAPPLESWAATYTVRRHLSLAANPFLRDHVIGAHSVLPTVCAGTWIAHSCQELFPGYRPFSIEDLTVLKGIVFDDELAAEHVLEISREVGDSSRVVCQGRIWSQTASGTVRHHYRARVTLVRELPDSPRHEPALPPPNDVSRDGATLYASRVLFHGPTFQGVRRVLHLDSSGLTLECYLAPVARQQQGQFPVRSFNPFLADVQLQSQVIWTRLVKDTMTVPVRGGRVEHYRPLAFAQTFYVSLAVRRADEYRTVADITAWDEEGRVCVRFLESETVSSPNLNHLVTAAGRP